MMLFKQRSTPCIPVCGRGPVSWDPMDESRAFQTCEHVALGPDVLVTEGRWDRVDALILAVDDNRLRVRATQSFSGEPGSLDIVEGEEFEISRSQVFAVSITTDPAQKP